MHCRSNLLKGDPKQNKNVWFPIPRMHSLIVIINTASEQKQMGRIYISLGIYVLKTLLIAYLGYETKERSSLSVLYLFQFNMAALTFKLGFAQFSSAYCERILHPIFDCFGVLKRRRSTHSETPKLLKIGWRILSQ